MPASSLKKNEYARAVSLFLAELLRNHKTSLERAAEIAQKTLENINLIDTEQQFLEFVKVLSSDFEELHHLGEVFHMHMKISERKFLEDKVRLFVIQLMSSNIAQATEVLNEAIKDDVSVDVLYIKFPEFKEFMRLHPDNNAGRFHDHHAVQEGGSV